MNLLSTPIQAENTNNKVKLKEKEKEVKLGEHVEFISNKRMES